jgi:hypothetical protein
MPISIPNLLACRAPCRALPCCHGLPCFHGQGWMPATSCSCKTALLIDLTAFLKKWDSSMALTAMPWLWWRALRWEKEYL